MPSYRDDREALRAKAERLEKELAEARRQLSQERREEAEVERLEREVRVLRKEARARKKDTQPPQPSATKDRTTPTQLTGPRVLGIIVVVILAVMFLLARVAMD